MPEARCAHCGFLAARHRETRALMEVEISMRDSWRIPLVAAESPIFEPIPVCFARAIRFDKLLEGPNDVMPMLRTALLNATRDCSEFVPWEQGLTPKEHYEMVMAERIRVLEENQARLQREWQDSWRRADRRWQIVLAFAALAGASGIAAWIISLIG